jgi:hypothetical protein
MRMHVCTPSSNNSRIYKHKKTMPKDQTYRALREKNHGENEIWPVALSRTRRRKKNCEIKNVHVDGGVPCG